MKHPPETILHARELYARLGSFSEVGAAMGMNNTTIREWALARKPDGQKWTGYRPKPSGKASHGGNRL